MSGQDINSGPSDHNDVRPFEVDALNGLRDNFTKTLDSDVESNDSIAFNRVRNFMNSDISEWSTPAKVAGALALVPAVAVLGAVAGIVEGTPLK